MCELFFSERLPEASISLINLCRSSVSTGERWYVSQFVSNKKNQANRKGGAKIVPLTTVHQICVTSPVLCMTFSFALLDAELLLVKNVLVYSYKNQSRHCSVHVRFYRWACVAKESPHHANRKVENLAIYSRPGFMRSSNRWYPVSAILNMCYCLDAELPATTPNKLLPYELRNKSSFSWDPSFIAFKVLGDFSDDWCSAQRDCRVSVVTESNIRVFTAVVPVQKLVDRPARREKR